MKGRGTAFELKKEIASPIAVLFVKTFNIIKFNFDFFRLSYHLLKHVIKQNMKLSKIFLGVALLTCLSFFALKSPKEQVTFTGGAYSYAFNRFEIMYHKILFGPCKLFISDFTFCEDKTFEISGCTGSITEGTWRQSQDTIYLSYETENCIKPPYLIIDGDLLLGKSNCPEFRVFYKQRLNKN